MSGKQRSRLITDIISLGIIEVIKYILGVAIVLSSSVLASQVLANMISFFQQYKIILGIIFGCLGVLVFIYAVEYFHRDRPHFPKIRFDFKIRQKVVTYEFTDRYNITFTKKVCLTVLKNDSNRYLDKYKWSGEGPIYVKSNRQGQEINQIKEPHSWDFYYIEFGRHLKRNENIDTEIVWQLTDVKCKAKPSFSCTIEEPTDELIMNLIIPNNLGVTGVVCDVSPHAGAKTPFHSQVRSFERDIITWKISKPKLLYHYELRWVFPEDITVIKPFLTRV